MFGEKATEYSKKQGKDVPVWQSPAYQVSKAKAIEVIRQGKWGLTEADFWILQNETKNGKVAYTGLIISHKGCLKINEALEDKFKPGCLTYDKEGYDGSLVYIYCNCDQGIYEVGEVNKGNCKIEYPYAMAFKRCFDRVVLKLCKLAYDGIYSEVEADEFRNPMKEPEVDAQNLDEDPNVELVCDDCGAPFMDIEFNGTKMTARECYDRAFELRGRHVCNKCFRKVTSDESKNAR